MSTHIFVKLTLLLCVSQGTTSLYFITWTQNSGCPEGVEMAGSQLMYANYSEWNMEEDNQRDPLK